MTYEPDNIEGLLTLRKLTRSVSDLLRDRMKSYLATLSPLLRPRLVFGDYVQGTSKEPAKHADAAFKELVALHDRLASAKPFGLRTPLANPVHLSSSTLEIAPLEYAHMATRGGETRAVLVRSPLKWVVSYSGYSPNRLKELLADRQRSAEELHDFLVNYLVLNIVMTRQTGVAGMLEALQFPVSTTRIEEFGDLPVTVIGSTVSTRRPSDDILIQSAELSGMDAFEEVLRLEDVGAMREPLKEELAALVGGHGMRT